MCGRFTLVSPAQRWAALFGVDPGSAGAFAPRYNVAPGQDVLAVRARAGAAGRELVRLRWGLVPSWAKEATIGRRLVNARAESLAEKPAFRSALRQRRCLVVADGFFEWQGAKSPRRPHYFRLRDGGAFGIAALWERWIPPDGASGDAPAPLETCTLVTTAANADVAPVHDRMPVILPPDGFAAWLAPQPGAAAAAAALLRPAADGTLVHHPVGPSVNDARFDGAACIEPAPA